MSLIAQISFIFSLGMNFALAQSPERLADDAIYLEQLGQLQGLNSNYIKGLIPNAKKTVPAFDESQFLRLSHPLDLGVWWWYPKAYGFQRLMKKSTVSWGMWSSQNHDILALKIDPLVPAKKLVIFAHGYLDHAAGSTNFYEELIDHNMAVASFDLPGHGLSSGISGSIDDFETYARILGDFFKRFEGQYEEIVVAGFSTGGSSILEARRLNLIPKETRAVLISPLVRVKHYWAIEPAFLTMVNLRFSMNWPILDLVIYPDRWIRDVSHDPYFMDVLRADPISPTKIPTAWTLAYIEYANRWKTWSESLSESEKQNFGKTLMLQGSDDQVVEGSVGMDMVAKTFPGTQIFEIHGGYHALLNEGVMGSTDLLPQVYNPILHFIESAP